MFGKRNEKVSGRDTGKRYCEARQEKASVSGAGDMESVGMPFQAGGRNLSFQGHEGIRKALAEYRQENQRFRMENERLRDFLRSAERK